MSGYSIEYEDSETLRMMRQIADSPGDGRASAVGRGIVLIERLERMLAESQSENASLKANRNDSDTLLRRASMHHEWSDAARLNSEKRISDLEAEVERLTPREMTLQQACDVLTKDGKGDVRWVASADGKYAMLYGDDPRWVVTRLRKQDAIYIAQGLERDAKGGG